VQWGRHSWNGRLPSLTFTWQVEVANADDVLDPYRQPEYWETELTLCFADDATLSEWMRLPNPTQGSASAALAQRERELIAMRATIALPPPGSPGACPP
jgi:hypothetical protein